MPGYYLSLGTEQRFQVTCILKISFILHLKKLILRTAGLLDFY